MTDSTTASAAQRRSRSNRDWWPDGVDVSVLHAQPAYGNPMGPGFDYAEAFSSLDLAAVKRDIAERMTRSHDWWPADPGVVPVATVVEVVAS